MYFHFMRKNSHDRILKREFKEQHLNTVIKSYSFYNMIIHKVLQFAYKHITHLGCIWHWLKRQFFYILLFSLILLLFMGLITFFDNIYESHCIISALYMIFSAKSF